MLQAKECRGSEENHHGEESVIELKYFGNKRRNIKRRRRKIQQQ